MLIEETTTDTWVKGMAAEMPALVGLFVINGLIGLLTLCGATGPKPAIAWNTFVIVTGVLIPDVWYRFFTEGFANWPVIPIFMWLGSECWRSNLKLIAVSFTVRTRKAPTRYLLAVLPQQSLHSSSPPSPQLGRGLRSLVSPLQRPRRGPLWSNCQAVAGRPGLYAAASQ